MITLTVCCGICVELSIRSKSYYFNTTAIYCKLCRLSLIRFQGSCLVFILVPFTFHFLFDFFCNRSLNLSDWNRSVNKYSCRHACAVTMAESELVSFDFEIFGIVQGKESCVLWFYFVYFYCEPEGRIISSPFVATHWFHVWFTLLTYSYTAL